MAYANYSKYASLYKITSSELSEADFDRLNYDASIYMDSCTTGIDGVKKLKVAYPENRDDSEAVIRCACALIHIMSEIESAEKNAAIERKYISREDGTVMRSMITSVSSGSESISYAVSSNTPNTALEKAISNTEDQKKLFFSTVKKYLSGAKDANGVNLMYGGIYPYVL